MPERRGSRFVVEALFLAALTVALALAHLDVIEIVGAMALGWIVVAGIEWAAWRSEPHFGSGLPPRYYLPRVELPPPQPLEQVVQGYPDSGRDDAPTWIASAALRAEVLGEWPHLAPVRRESDKDDGLQFTSASDPGVDPWKIQASPAEPVSPVVEGAPQRASSARPPALAAGQVGTARYTVDPLGEGEPRHRLSRRGSKTEYVFDVPAHPPRRVLPSSLTVR